MRTLLAGLGIALASASSAGASSPAPPVRCADRCVVEVSGDGFRPRGAGADGKTMNARVGARVIWRLRLVAGDDSRHTVSSDQGFFRSPLLRNRVGDAIYWAKVMSAGGFPYHDSVGNAGSGLVLVVPSVQREAGALRFTWASPRSTLGNAYSVRWLVLDGAEEVGTGTLHPATWRVSRAFARGERLGGRTLLSRGRILCVEARTGLLGEGWSDWARNCAVVR